jgi:uncharacterized protein
MIRAAARLTSVKIDLANIAGTPGARGRFSIAVTLASNAGFTYAGPVTGEITVENSGPLLIVRGRLRAALRLTCVRCLCEGDWTTEIDVREEFATDLTAPDVDTIDRDEPEESAIEDYVLDVSELVRQQVVVSVPMAFVCRPDCRGICSQCGKNLNEGACQCDLPEGDPRWSKLRDLAEPRGPQSC